MTTAEDNPGANTNNKKVASDSNYQLVLQKNANEPCWASCSDKSTRPGHLSDVSGYVFLLLT